MTFFITNAAGSATSGDGRAKGRAGSSRKWPMIVVGMLVAHASLWVGAVFIARSNATFAVEPDYYQKALHWDETAAQAAENRRLGWGMTWELSAAGGADQTRRVTATLVNRDGTPLDGAAIDVEVFSHRRGQERRRFSLTPGGDGKYSVDITGMQPGVWEFRAEARRGPETFTSTQQLTAE
jgi:nitrogen fixation protein FixH